MRGGSSVCETCFALAMDAGYAADSGPSRSVTPVKADLPPD